MLRDDDDTPAIHDKPRLREVRRKIKNLRQQGTPKVPRQDELAVLEQREKEICWRRQVLGTVISHLAAEAQQIGTPEESGGEQLQAALRRFRKQMEGMRRHQPASVTYGYDEEILLSEEPEPLREFIASLKDSHDRTIMLLGAQEKCPELLDQVAMTAQQVRYVQENRSPRQLSEWLSANSGQARAGVGADCNVGHEERALIAYMKHWRGPVLCQHEAGNLIRCLHGLPRRPRRM